MIKIFNYDISNYDISTALKTKDAQFDEFYYSGHPLFLIPDFSEYPDDIWLSFLSFLEKEKGKDCYNDDGGEIIENTILDENNGYSRCVYDACEINFSKDEETKNYQVEVFGYIIIDEDNSDDKFTTYYFLATEVNIKIKEK